MKKLAIKALGEFGITEVEAISRIENKDMWNIDDKYFIKIYPDLNRLERTLLIYDELCQAGVPVAIYNKTHTGELYVKINDIYYTVTAKVRGSHVDYKIEANPFSFGENMARLHIGLKKLTEKIKCEAIADLIDQLHGWILKEITEKKIEIRKEIIDYCIGFDELYRKLPMQIIHRDLHGGNMLFENGELSAFLDFDISQANTRLFDFCYCMDAGTECMKSDETFIKWLETFKFFLSGYNSISEITDKELEALPYMFVLIQLLTVAFYSSIDRLKYKVDENLEYLNWLYDNRNRFLFFRQDMYKVKCN